MADLHMHLSPIHLAVLAFASASVPLVAANDLPVTDPSNTSTFTVIFENDLFGDTDEQYTNGIQIGWLSRDLKQYGDATRVPDWLLDVASWLPFVNEPNRQHNVGFTVGQQIFTPKDVETKTLIKDDRPYGGWLYAGISFISKTEENLDTLEIQGGVIGAWSLAEEAQNLVHSVRDLPTAKGWDHQLENEPGLEFIYEHKNRLLRSTNARGWGYDAITHVGGAVGNVSTYANAGAEVRVGWNLPADYGSPLIKPGGDTNAPSSVNDPRLRNEDPFGAHLFAGLSGRCVLRDIFLDGNSFADSHSIDKERWVGDLVIGGSVTLYQLKLSYTQAFRTREFEGQARLHNFGSITLSWTF
jgi:lipid A 3-O-deacylase